MKTVIFLVALIATVFGQYDGVCLYTSSNNDIYQIQQTYFNVLDNQGNTWYFSVCGNAHDINSMASPCEQNLSSLADENTAICMVDSFGAASVRGLIDTAVWGDSPYGASSGAEVIYGSNTTCASGSLAKTAIDFVCDQEQSTPNVNVVSSDGCFTTITVQWNAACSAEVVEIPIPESSHSSMQFVFLLSMILACLCTCCCCLCAARRRRQLQQKNIQMRQFSNVAFQPIPVTQSTSVTYPAQQAPSFNPYITQTQPQAQQQFYYYYPNNQNTFPQYTPSIDISEDERIAKDLQRQYDQEAQV